MFVVVVPCASLVVLGCLAVVLCVVVVCCYFNSLSCSVIVDGCPLRVDCCCLLTIDNGVVVFWSRCYSFVLVVGVFSCRLMRGLCLLLVAIVVRSCLLLRCVVVVFVACVVSSLSFDICAMC